jgi:hypothetical protein
MLQSQVLMYFPQRKRAEELVSEHGSNLQASNLAQLRAQIDSPVQFETKVNRKQAYNAVDEAIRTAAKT